MPPLSSILNRSVSSEEFHAQVSARLAPRVAALRDRAKLIRGKFPQLVPETLHKAEAAFNGMLVLPGTGGKPHFVGNPPQWSDRRFNDDEYVWGINRMAHWIPMLRSYTLTGEVRYAQKVTDELRDWIKTCPRPVLRSTEPSAAENPWEFFHEFSGVTPWRSLEVGIRMFRSWPQILPHLLGTEFLTPELLAEYAGSLFEHGEVLYQVCPLFWPTAAHNHYLMENLGLLEISTLLPELSTADQWRAFAMRELERCAHAQITPEGGQVEGCPHYHNGCIDWFVHGMSLAHTNGLSFSAEFSSLMKRAFEYSLHCIRPSGTAVPWGDSDADVAVAIRAALSGFRQLRDPDYLQIATECFGVEEVRRCCLESAWDHDDIEEILSSIDKAANPTRPVSFPVDSWQKSLSQAMLRTDWSHEALSVFFACRTPIDNGHAHIDPMSFDFTAHGRALVVDPGRFTYRDDPDRREFKSAAYHNTLVINGRDPFEYINTWAYGPQKDGRITGVRLEPGSKAAFARHDNYEPAIHHRAVALIEDVALLVIDRVESLQPGDLIQLYFHLDSVQVTCEEATGRTETYDAGQANVLIVPSAGVTGELLPGRISDFTDIYRPSRRLCLTAPRSEETSRVFATVLVPWPASAEKPEVTEPEVTFNSETLSCSFQVSGHTHTFHWP